MFGKMERTARGFRLYNFEDRNGEKCSLQKSSVATEDLIWLGIDDANPQILASHTPEGGTGWVPYEIPESVLLTTRMHLTREQARELAAQLIYFADNGELPRTPYAT